MTAWRQDRLATAKNLIERIRMFEAAIDVLNKLGIMPVIQMVAVSVGAIFIYRYFTDKG